MEMKSRFYVSLILYIMWRACKNLLNEAETNIQNCYAFEGIVGECVGGAYYHPYTQNTFDIGRSRVQMSVLIS